jgi:hypothetical protein
MAKKKTTPRNWEHELTNFELQQRYRTRRYPMSSAGVAQVTRCRLIATYPTMVQIRTERHVLVFERD